MAKWPDPYSGAGTICKCIDGLLWKSDTKRYTSCNRWYEQYDAEFTGLSGVVGIRCLWAGCQPFKWGSSLAVVSFWRRISCILKESASILSSSKIRWYRGNWSFVASTCSSNASILHIRCFSLFFRLFKYEWMVPATGWNFNGWNWDRNDVCAQARGKVQAS